MPGRLFTLASAASLLVFTASIAASIHSLHKTFGFGSVRDDFQLRVALSNAIFTFDIGIRYADLKVEEDGWYAHTNDAPNSSTEWFAWRREVSKTPLAGWDVRILRFPLPLLSPFLAILPARYVRRRSRRARAGICSSCSYDLTGNTSGVCPECGTATKKGLV